MNRFIALILIPLTLISFCFCAKSENASCREILSAITECEAGLPAGRIYSMKADAGDREFLSDSLLSALYGDGGMPPAADGWLDCAIFLSSPAHICELAVFLCDSPDTATDTARMLCRRLDLIRVAKGDGKYAFYLDSATVTVMRNYVLFVISSDSENAIRVASKIIR